MNPTHAALLRSMSGLASRRGIIAGLASGLLATGIVAVKVDDAEARKKGKRKNKKRKQKNKKDRPVTRADATCSSGPEGNFLAADKNERLAQTFTAIASGPLVRVELPISKQTGSSGDYLLQLSPVDDFAVPTNEVLAVALVANRDVPAGVTTVSFSFTRPFAVVAGTTYALVLSRQGDDDAVWQLRREDPCAGQPFFSLNQTAPFETETFGISSDLSYTTFVTS